MTSPILDLIPIVSQVRRNHGLEHATLHVISEKLPGISVAGVSSLYGFILLADLPTESVTEAVLEALKRLKGGETTLAVHENCGTNLAVSSFLAAGAAWLAMAGTGKDAKLRLYRLPLAVLLAIPIFFLSKPLGPWLQQHLTTSAVPENMSLAQVSSLHVGGRNIHTIRTSFS